MKDGNKACTLVGILLCILWAPGSFELLVEDKGFFSFFKLY